MTDVKWCSRCEVTKPLDAFGSHRGKAGGRNVYCRSCCSERARIDRVENPERYRRRDRAKALRRAGRSVIVVPESKRCRECHDVKMAAEFSPDRRRSDGLQAKCKECRRRWHWKVDRFEIFEREGGRCHICSKPVSRDDFHVEHLFPRAAGGSSDPSNLAVAHPACNAAKGDSVGPVQLRLAG